MAERSYEDLEATCARLKAESGRHLVMQQELIVAKDQVDAELMRFKAIQAYVAEALEAGEQDVFFTLTLEAIIQAFEFEVALFLLVDEAGGQFSVVGEFGLEDAPPVLSFSPDWLVAPESRIENRDDTVLQAWSGLALAQAIICPFHNQDGTLAGAVLGGISETNVEVYEPISAEHKTSFTVLVQQAGSLWTNRKLNDAVRRQNEQLLSLTSSYSRFVPFQFLDLLDRTSIEDVDTGDHVALEMNVMFGDIRNFTALSEALGPTGTFALLNGFLASVEPVIDRQKGFINKYLGDAIMALFPHGADAGLHCAIAMFDALRLFNERRLADGEVPVRIGLGISSGPLMLGAIGGGKRLDSNAIGDTANLASRVEELTKHYGVPALFTDHTRERLHDPDAFLFREVDLVMVRGRGAAVSIHELVGCDSQPIQEQKAATRAEFAEALALYRCGAFGDALKRFQECATVAPGDNVTALFAERCHRFLQTPPPEPWNGVWVLDTPSSPGRQAAGV